MFNLNDLFCAFVIGCFSFCLLSCLISIIDLIFEICMYFKHKRKAFVLRQKIFEYVYYLNQSNFEHTETICECERLISLELLDLLDYRFENGRLVKVNGFVARIKDFFKTPREKVSISWLFKNWFCHSKCMTNIRDDD